LSPFHLENEAFVDDMSAVGLPDPFEGVDWLRSPSSPGGGGGDGGRVAGGGIAPERLGELFLPFSQADGSIARRYGGSGLGLVISQRLCELMGGRLQVDSQPGVGSTFSFELELPIAEARPVSPDTTRLLYQRVLVVDDQAQERQRVADLLESWRVDAVQAGGGREAIELIARSPGQTGQPFDLVLLDGDMPEMDGLDVSRWILKSTADGHLPRAPAIFLMAAASDRQQLIREAVDLQLGAILPKPGTASRLWSAPSAPRGARLPRSSWLALQELHRRAALITGAHVLVVEDTADSQLVARMMLERLGLRVTVADNGQQALDLLDRKRTRLNSSHITRSYAVLCLTDKRRKTQAARCERNSLDRTG